MKAKIFFSIFLLIILVSFISAASHTITIRGEPRTPDGKIDLMYDAGVYGAQGKVTADVTLDNDNGFFGVKSYTFDDVLNQNGVQLVNQVSVGAQGSCFNHGFYIKWQNNRYEVFDAYGSQSSETLPLMTTSSNNIDLGILKEDKSNQVMVDFDIPVSFKAEDMDGNVVAENTGFRKFTGMSDSFQSNTRYKLTLTTEDGKQITKEITTSANYCESTRVIKRGSYFLVENFPGNSFPQIGFFSNIWMSILGGRMIVIIPIITLILLIILAIVLIIRKKKSSNPVS